MNIFLAYAHLEPQSFNAVLKDTAVAALRTAGHVVQVSDLYAMDFNPVADATDFRTPRDASCIHYSSEQELALPAGEFAADIREEQEKLRWCHALILQFPLWWLGPPAILKGWIDRVLPAIFSYADRDRRARPPYAGKRAMVAVTTGGPPSAYQADGYHGPIDGVLHPLQHGVLHLLGFSVVPPFIAWAPARATSADRECFLDEYRRRVLTMGTVAPLEYAPVEAYDEEYRRITT